MHSTLTRNYAMRRCVIVPTSRHTFDCEYVSFCRKSLTSVRETVSRFVFCLSLLSLFFFPFLCLICFHVRVKSETNLGLVPTITTGRGNSVSVKQWLKSEGNISLCTALLCSRSLGHGESKDGRTDSARGNQMCVKLSDLFPSFSSFSLLFPLHPCSFTVGSNRIARDRLRRSSFFFLFFSLIVQRKDESLLLRRGKEISRSVYVTALRKMFILNRAS